MTGESRMPTPFPISEMQPDDYNAVLGLWQRCEGVGLTPSDTLSPGTTAGSLVPS